MAEFTTDELALPYPDSSEPADVPADLLQIVNRVEAILTAGHDSIWNAGDFKVSVKAATHGRWLLCDGTEKTAAEIVTATGLDAGDADALVTLLGTGGASIYGAAAAGKVLLPDPRSRAVLLAGPGGGGLTARARGAVGGVEQVTLSAAESGVRDHAHEAGSLKVPDNQTISASGPAGTTNNYVLEDGDLDVSGDTSAVTSSHHASNGDAAEQDHENMPPYLVIGSLFIRV